LLQGPGLNHQVANILSARLLLRLSQVAIPPGIVSGNEELTVAEFPK
jgi:hypothetical protein